MVDLMIRVKNKTIIGLKFSWIDHDFIISSVKNKTIIGLKYNLTRLCSSVTSC